MERISGKKNEFINLLKMTAPGTPLREGLDNVLRAKTGGLKSLCIAYTLVMLSNPLCQSPLIGVLEFTCN